MLPEWRSAVPGSRDGWRLDRFLREGLPVAAAKSIRYAIDAGNVHVDGWPAKKGRALRAGEVVVADRVPEERDWLPVPGDVPGASVLYEDGEVAVLSKPVDVHCEPQRPMERGTLSGFLAWIHPDVASISGEPGLTLLTRLDYATSGAVPAALTPEAFAFLLREREQGRIVKSYVCLVAGLVEKEMSLAFRIDTAGGERVRVQTGDREPDPLRWTVVKPIRTGEGGSIVRATISKGKRHQIRAHLAAAGFPIVGDRRYSTVPPEGPGNRRLMLHASQVRFAHPSGKGIVVVESPTPEEFGAL